jgi:hypothetical protein
MWMSRMKYGVVALVAVLLCRCWDPSASLTPGRAKQVIENDYGFQNEQAFVVVSDQTFKLGVDRGYWVTGQASWEPAPSMNRYIDSIDQGSITPPTWEVVLRSKTVKRITQIVRISGGSENTIREVSFEWVTDVSSLPVSLQTLLENGVPQRESKVLAFSDQGWRVNP